MVLTVILFLALLSLLVLVHEWGHYAAAKKMGMTVEEFGLGFPPRLFAKKTKSGMELSVNAIPLGGFVKIKGESGEGRDAPDSFASKSIPARFFVLIAGVAMNLVLAAALFTFGYGVGLPAIVEGGVEDGAVITDKALHIVEVLPGSVAESVGLEVGDRIVTIDGEMFESGEAAREALVANADGMPIEMIVLHEGEQRTVEVTPTFIEEAGKEAVGVALVETGFVRYPWYQAPFKGVMTMIGSTWQVVAAFGGLIASAFQDDVATPELSGPVGIAVLTGQVAELGVAHLVQFAAMLSINLAVINVLPFPALDGGRIFFLFAEAIRRKPASPQFEQAVHAAGFMFLLLVVLFVTYKDIVNFF